MLFLEQFLYYLNTEKRLSGSTVLSYKTDVHQFSDFLKKDGFGDDLLRVSPLEIRQWVIYLMDSGLTARSVHRKMSSLRHFYRYFIREGHIRNNPADGLVLPKTSRKLPVYVEEDAMQRLFEDIEFTADFQGIQDRLILELLYGSGLRLSELIHLRKDQVDTERQVLRIRGKGSKDRLVPYPRCLQGLIRDYLEIRVSEPEGEDASYFFLTEKGKKLYPKFVYRLVNKYLSYVTTVKKRSPHTLRHSYATHLLNHGADLNAIKELLGHSSLAATQVYTHTDLAKLKRIHKKAHPRAND